MFQLPRNITPTGYDYIKEDLGLRLLPFYAAPNGTTRFRLGAPFLSTNYLVVNLENRTFSLAPARLTRTSREDGKSDIPIVGSTDCDGGPPSTRGGSPIGEPDDPNTSTPEDIDIPDNDGERSAESPARRLDTRTIIAIAVSSSVGLGLCILFGCLFYKKFVGFHRAPKPPNYPGQEAFGVPRCEIQGLELAQELKGNEIYHMGDHWGPAPIYEMPA